VTPAAGATPAADVAFRPSGSASSTESLNDRLKHLQIGGDVDYAPKRVAVGDAQSVFDNAEAAYLARFAPPPDILRRTFGFIYARRTTGAPDSLAYVYDTYALGPITMCKAWKIVEHPYVPIHEIGAVGGSAGIGGAVASSANSSNVRHDNGGDPDISTVVFPCSPKSYTAIRPGSLTTPLPLHPDITPAPAAGLSLPAPPPRPTPSLAPP